MGEIPGRKPETGELPLSGRMILVTAGVSGIGLEISRQILSLGGIPIVTTHSEKHYREIPTLLGNSAVPLFFDVTEPKQIQEGLNKLPEKRVDITDTILCQADGIKVMPLLREVRNFSHEHPKTQLATLSPDERKPFYTGLRKKIADTQKDEKTALDVNYFGSINVLTGMMNQEAYRPRTFIYLSSLLSSLYGKIPTSAFYGNVAKSKHMMETLLKSNGDIFDVLQIHPAIVSANLVPDTGTGSFLRLAANYFPEEDLPDLTDLPKTPDVAHEIIRILLENPASWKGVRTSYVISPHEIVNNLDMVDPHRLTELTKNPF